MYHLRRARRLGDRSRGAAAVEAALVLPVILLIFFAILEFGLLFKDWLGVVSAVRAGARIASAEPRQAGFANDAILAVQNASAGIDPTAVTNLWVYDADATGNPPSSCTGKCIRYAWNGISFISTNLSAWDPLTQDACIGDLNHTTIGIYMEVNHKSFTNAIFSTIVLREHVVMSLEPMPTSNVCK